MQKNPTSSFGERLIKEEQKEIEKKILSEIGFEKKRGQGQPKNLTQLSDN